MRWPVKLLLAAFAAALLSSTPFAAAETQTVCTITVNSADEKEAFRRYLPAAKYEFVELVERGRPDWLASACHAGVTCDVLIISGHYDGGNEFFSDRLEVSEFLPVDELERVSCSDSCRAGQPALSVGRLGLHCPVGHPGPPRRIQAPGAGPVGA